MTSQNYLLKLLQWESMGVYVSIGFFGINTNLQIDPNLIPYIGCSISLQITLVGCSSSSILLGVRISAATWEF